MGRDSAGIFRRTTSTNAFEMVAPHVVQQFSEDPAGDIWAITRSGALISSVPGPFAHNPLAPGMPGVSFTIAKEICGLGRSGSGSSVHQQRLEPTAKDALDVCRR